MYSYVSFVTISISSHPVFSDYFIYFFDLLNIVQLMFLSIFHFQTTYYLWLPVTLTLGILHLSDSVIHSEYYTLSNFWLCHTRNYTRNITCFLISDSVTLGILHTHPVPSTLQYIPVVYISPLILSHFLFRPSFSFFGNSHCTQMTETKTV